MQRNQQGSQEHSDASLRASQGKTWPSHKGEQQAIKLAACFDIAIEDIVLQVVASTQCVESLAVAPVTLSKEALAAQGE